jgi:hypothetical protein
MRQPKSSPLVNSQHNHHHLSGAVTGMLSQRCDVALLFCPMPPVPKQERTGFLLCVNAGSVDMRASQ